MDQMESMIANADPELLRSMMIKMLAQQGGSRREPQTRQGDRDDSNHHNSIPSDSKTNALDENENSRHYKSNI